LGDQIEDEMGDHEACMGDEKYIKYFGWKTGRKETTWKT
jgi:hypothetical protein